MGFLTPDPLDVSAMIAEAGRDRDGAIAIFLGVVRNENGGAPVREIEYTAYQKMAESEMAKIAEELLSRFPQTRLEMRHRLGTLRVGEASVVIVASSPHRAEAFAACREAIERLKASVPIWKKER